MNDFTQLTDQQCYWLTHIEAAQQSSLSLAAYARNQGLAPPRKVANFAQVQVMATMTGAADAPIRLARGGGLSLACQHWPDSAWLARLAHLLDQGSRT